MILNNSNIYSKIISFLDAYTIKILNSVINTEKTLRMFYEYKDRLGHLRPIILNSFNESTDITMILLNLIKIYKIKFCHGCAKVLINEYLCNSCKNNLILCDHCNYYYTMHDLGFYESGKSICKFCYNNNINKNFFNYLDIIEKITFYLEQHTNIILMDCSVCYKNFSISIKYLTRKKLMKNNPNNTKITNPALFLLSDGNYGCEYVDQMEYIDSFNHINDNPSFDIMIDRFDIMIDRNYKNDLHMNYCDIYNIIYKKYKNNTAHCFNCISIIDNMDLL